MILVYNSWPGWNLERIWRNSVSKCLWALHWTVEQVCTCINYVASIFAAFLCSNVVIGNDYYCPSCPLQPCSGVGMETSARCMHVQGQEGGGGKGAMLQEQCMPILVPCLSCLFHCTKRYLQLIEFCNKRPWFKPFTSDFAHEMLIHSFCLKDLFIRISRYRFIVTADSIFTGHLVWHYP